VPRISQGSVVTHKDVIGLLTMILLQIYCWVCQCVLFKLQARV